MDIAIKKPELEQFLREQVEAGRYPSMEAVVEAAISDFRDSFTGDLDDETIAAINEAEQQVDRAETMDFESFRAQMNQYMARE